MMTSVPVIARLLLAAVFAISGIAKLADLKGTRRSMADFGLPTLLAGPAGLLLPFFELICAAALLPAAWSVLGAAGVLALLVLFILAMLVNIARGRTPDCHCFGQLHSERIGWKTILRNGVLAAIAAFVVWQGRETAPIGILAWLQTLGRFESVLLIGAAVAVLQLWLSVHLLRQNGRLLIRLEALEAKLSSPSEVPAAGLPEGVTAPDFKLDALDGGGAVTLDELNQLAQPLVLVFSEPDCSMCDLLMPELAKWQQEFRNQIWIGVICRGSADANRSKIAKLSIKNVLLQKDREVAAAYRVEGTPSAVLVKGGLIASQLAAGADAIRTLVSQATLPAPVSKGDVVPSLRLSDLTGKSIDLASFRGRRRLLLFWNPTCGFCQRMLSDVKAWERNPPPGAPELIIVSAGSFDANREQGFRSRVLLDPNFGAGHVFRSGGTPSAVMIDEQGRIASEVGVGAQEVFALAGAAPVVNGNSRPGSA